MQPKDEGVARSPPHSLTRFGIAGGKAKGVPTVWSAMGDPWPFLNGLKEPRRQPGLGGWGTVIAGGSMKVGE